MLTVESSAMRKPIATSYWATHQTREPEDVTEELVAEGQGVVDGQQETEAEVRGNRQPMLL